MALTPFRRAASTTAVPPAHEKGRRTDPQKFAVAVRPSRIDGQGHGPDSYQGMGDKAPKVKDP